MYVSAVASFNWLMSFYMLFYVNLNLKKTKRETAHWPAVET